MTKPTPYYRVNRKGRAYWCAGKAMRALGFRTVALGFDGDKARDAAQELTRQWREARHLSAAGPGAPEQPATAAPPPEAEDLIGFSRNPFSRAREVAGAAHGALTKALIVRGTRVDEQRLHDHFKLLRTNGEWFVATADLLGFIVRCAKAGKVVFGPKGERRVESTPKFESKQRGANAN